MSKRILANNNAPVLSEYKAVIVGHSSSPYITAYAWDNTTGFGTKFSDPSTLLTAGSTVVSVYCSSGVLGYSVSTSPYFGAYQFNSTSGFGTKYTDPASGPTAQGAIGLSKALNYAVLGSSDRVNQYPFSYSSGFGTKTTDPSGTISITNRVRFSDDGTICMICQTGSWIQKWSIVDLSDSDKTKRINASKSIVEESLSGLIIDKLDRFAQSKKYTDFITACTYINSNNFTYKSEALRCLELRDLLWASALEMLNQGKSLKDIDENLPVLTW